MIISAQTILAGGKVLLSPSNEPQRGPAKRDGERHEERGLKLARQANLRREKDWGGEGGGGKYE